MATRSRIATKREDGYESIYCHWDGYPEGVGATLKEHYTDQNKIDELIALADLSSLGETPAEEHTTSYNRWRDEGTTSKKHKTLEEVKKWAKDQWVEYLYVWNGTEWETYEV